MAKRRRPKRQARREPKRASALQQRILAVAGLAILAAGLWFIWQATRFPLRSGRFDMIVVVALLGVLGVLFLGAVAIRQATASKRDPEPLAPRAWRPWGDHPFVVGALLILAIVGAYDQLIPRPEGGPSLFDPFDQLIDTYYRGTPADPTNRPRRLAPYIVDRIPEPCLRRDVRRRLVWDLLESNLIPAAEGERPGVFRFDPENSDWHLLGDILLRMRDDDTCTTDFRNWWENDLKRHTRLIRWPTHGNELAKLYAWLESIYIGPAPATLPGNFPTPAERFANYPGTGLVTILLLVFGGTIVLLIAVSVHRLILLWRYLAFPAPQPPAIAPDESMRVLVQLPMFNERFVAVRALQAASRLEWPRDKLQIQVIDDSTDDTCSIVQDTIAELQRKGIHVQYVRRTERRDYKAGALAWGLEQAHPADLVCIFDADFVPPSDFLKKVTVHFSDPTVALVQCKWKYLNEEHSALTRLQALMLDGHFVVDHGGRHRSGCFFNFNGTAGIWRQDAIVSSGGWQGDTLTEDLDLSYRAQIRGWKFIYRPDVEVPCELPSDMLSLKAQQRRWSRGSFQTARKLLRAIWRSPVALRCKVEATVHLLTNGTYALVLVVSLLLLPAHYYAAVLGWTAIFDLESVLLFSGLFSAGLFYWTAGRAVGRRPVSCVASVVHIFLLGMGLSANNGWAAVRGLVGSRGEFVRTPKYGTSRQQRLMFYGKTWSLWLIVSELCLFVYLSLTVALTIRYVVPSVSSPLTLTLFPILYALSLGYVIAVTCAHLLQQGRQRDANSWTHDVMSAPRSHR